MNQAIYLANIDSPVVLYKQHSSGAVGTWTIWVQGNTIMMETDRTGRDNTTTVATEVVTEGKAGRSLLEQILLRVESRIRAKLDSGYKASHADTLGGAPTGQSGILLPMLAKADTKYLKDVGEIWVQPKLDGMRMIVHRTKDSIAAYSRKGKPIITVSHILNELWHVMSPGDHWDGELYAHGQSLQSIMSLAKRQQPDTFKLKYHIFDKIQSRTFNDRFTDLLSTFMMHDLKKSVLVNTQPLVDLDAQFSDARQSGYEGLILRDGNAPYEPGKRSNGLIKVKKFADAEYVIMDVTTGAQGEPVLVCDAGNGKAFRVTAPGTHANRRTILANAGQYIGRLATIKHSGLTPYGIPFHPVCKIIL
jgi:DNA ligase-1